MVGHGDAVEVLGARLVDELCHGAGAVGEGGMRVQVQPARCECHGSPFLAVVARCAGLLLGRRHSVSQGASDLAFVPSVFDDFSVAGVTPAAEPM